MSPELTAIIAVGLVLLGFVWRAERRFCRLDEGINKLKDGLDESEKDLGVFSNIVNESMQLTDMRLDKLEEKVGPP